jgi:hypothetical protein
MFGPVQVAFRDDGGLFIYQPEPGVVLDPGQVEDLIDWLVASRRMMHDTGERIPLDQVMEKIKTEYGAAIEALGDRQLDEHQGG